VVRALRYILTLSTSIDRRTDDLSGL